MCRVWNVKAAIEVGLRYVAHILKIIDCNQLQGPQLFIWSPVWVKVWMTSRNGIWRRDRAPTRLLFRVRQDVWLQVCRLRKLLVATLRNNNVHLLDYLLLVKYLEGADIGAISSMNAHMCPQVEVERESLSTALESALERLLPRVNKLVAFQFTALHKSLSTFGANMYPV